MSIKETITKTSTAYKYRLLIAFLISGLGILSTVSKAQDIAGQQRISDPVEDYIDAIDTVEAEYSSYSTELSDLYLGLGKSLYLRQNYTEARQAFQRGMQIERVNYGLNSLSQAPYLLSIADTESFLGNWNKSKEALDNFDNINIKAYGKNNVRMLPALDQMLDWYMDSYEERTTNGGYANLVISERIAMRMASILQSDVSLDNPESPDRYRRLGYLQYFIANHIKQNGEPSQSGMTISAGSSGVRAQNTTSHMHFRRGKAALEKVVESLVQQKNSSILDQALALAELGDWYLVFGQKSSAKEAYQLAHDVLEESEKTVALREEVFSKPRMITFKMDKKLNSVTTLEEELSETQVQVKLTVSDFGVPFNIAVLDPLEDLSKEQLQALLKEVNQQRFRPRLNSGKTEEAELTIFYDKPTPKS